MPFEDSSAGASEVHTPTIVGATIDTTTYKYGGGSGKFVQASSQYVTYPTSDDWILGLGDFTVSAWIYKPTGVSVDHYFGLYANAHNRLSIRFSDTEIYAIAKVSGFTRITIYKTGLSMSDGWHHIEIGRDTSVSGYIFIDGVKQTLETNTYDGELVAYGATFTVGVLYDLKSSGYIDVLKIDKGICRHTSDFTPPANEDVDNDSYTVLRLTMNPPPPIPFSINIGDTWTELRPIGDAEDQWQPIACSADGSFIIAGANSGRLWTSIDSGASWTERQPAGAVDRKWTGVACDSDGSNLIVCCYNAGAGTGRLYTSSNGGASWTERRPYGANHDYYWNCVCSDNDGSVLLAGQDGYDGSICSGRLWLSIDAGVNWSEVRPAGNADMYWTSVACDSDGSNIIACHRGTYLGPGGGRAYTSVNTGASWAETQPLGNVDEYWGCVDTNDDGSILLACPIRTHSGRVHRSVDGGANWSVIDPYGNYNWIWNYLSMSSDGNTIIVIGWFNVNGVFISKDGGSSWSNNGPAGSIGWRGCDVSLDGSQLVICSFSVSPSPIVGRIYRYSDAWKEGMSYINIDDAWKEGTSYINIEETQGWLVVTNSLEEGIFKACIHNGELYAIRAAGGGDLLKWNGSDAWEVVATQLGSYDEFYSLCSFNGTIYAGTFSTGDSTGGCLLEWDGVDSWSLVAPKLGSQEVTCDLREFNGKLYGGMNAYTVGIGALYEWNGTNAWVSVAPSLGGQTIWSLCEFNGKLYGGTAGGGGAQGKLYEWNGTNAWVSVASQKNSQTVIYTMIEFDGELYGGTDGGYLFKWNGSNAWVSVASPMSPAAGIWSLAIYNGELYGGTYPLGKLYKFTGSAWLKVASQLAIEIYFTSIVTFNNNLYGAMWGGHLFKYTESGHYWKPLSNLYMAQGGNAGWESVKDNTWEDLASENWDYQKQSWRKVI